MKIAVAGSDGFVGNNVCNLLKSKGHSIVKIDITRGYDLCDYSIVNKIESIDCFIHLANLVYVPASYKFPERYYRINYLTTLNALEICRKYNARMIYASSYIYGTPRYLPVDENHPLCPFNPYSETKLICEKLCEGYNRDFNINVSILRPFNIYGVGQKGKLLIPEIIEQIKRGKDVIKLKSATPRRDYVNVIDVARAFMVCVNDKSSYNIYNVCSGKSLSVREVTEIINNHLKHKVNFLFSESDRQNEVEETVGSCRKLEGLGWNCSISFDNGIAHLLKSENI